MQQELETKDADLKIEKGRKKEAQALAVTAQTHQTAHLWEETRLTRQLSKLEKQSKRAREGGIQQLLQATQEQKHEEEAATRHKQKEEATAQLEKEKTAVVERALNAEKRVRVSQVETHDLSATCEKQQNVIYELTDSMWQAHGLVAEHMKVAAQSESEVQWVAGPSPQVVHHSSKHPSIHAQT